MILMVMVKALITMTGVDDAWLTKLMMMTMLMIIAIN